MSAQQQTSTKYNPGIDGLRCFAVLWIIVHNAGSKLVGDRDFHELPMQLTDQLIGTGWQGVQMFFVISGFLVTRILLENRGQQSGLQTYLVRRVLRIFPVYFLFLGFFIFILPLVAIDVPWAANLSHDQFWYWTYTMNWYQPLHPEFELPHLWSLAVEEQFYLFWPLLILYLPGRFLPWVMIGAILLATCIRTVLLILDDEWMRAAAYFWTICRFDALGAGGLLAWLCSVGRQPGKKGSLLILMIGISAMLVVILVERKLDPMTPGFGIMNQTISTLLFFGLMSYVVQEKTLLHRFLAFLPFVWIGRISYAMYLFHLPVFKGWFEYMPIPDPAIPETFFLLQVIGHLTVIVTITIALAGISWVLIERPTLKLKRYFSYRSPGSDL